MENEKLFIEGFSDARAVGVTIHFNRPTTIQLSGVKSKTWFVSWDNIGKGLCGTSYTGNESKQSTAQLESFNVMGSFKVMDDFAASSLPPELYSKWCELVGYWSNFTTSLSGVQEDEKQY